MQIVTMGVIPVHLHPLLYEKARLLLQVVIKASLLLRKEKNALQFICQK